MKKYIFPAENCRFHVNFSERTIQNTALHIHDFYEWELVLSGDAITVINGIEYPASKGAVFFLTPSDVHSYHAEEGVTVINLSFTPDVMEYSVLLEMLYPMDYLVGQADETLLGILAFYARQIGRLIKKPDRFTEKQVSALMTCLLVEMHHISTVKASRPARQIDCLPVQKALWLIHAHFREELSLSSLAKQIGIPSSTLGKKFAGYYGIGFRQYLMNIRLQYARSLITNTHETLTDIAYYSGFNSLSYFQRAFLGKYGVSPNSLRKRET